MSNGFYGFSFPRNTLVLRKPEATGGTISISSINSILMRNHKFTVSGNFIVTKEGFVEILLVGGGGSGGYGGAGDRGGGGGAGGLLWFTNFYVSVGTHTITVGATSAVNGQGGNTTYDTSRLIALGGGKGGNNNQAPTAPTTGGSGGGGQAGVASYGLGTVPQGYRGGGGTWESLTNGHCGGGGGYSSQGITYNVSTPSDGGFGLASSEFDPVIFPIGCAGGGGAPPTGQGYHGGGNNGVAGTANTGGGGGGGGLGASGICVIRYRMDR